MLGLEKYSLSGLVVKSGPKTSVDIVNTNNRAGHILKTLAIKN